MKSLVLLGSIALAGTGFGATVTVLEEIVCKVNGDIVTRTDLKRDGAATPRHTSDLLRDRIDALLLVQRGHELRFDIEREVNRRLTELQQRSEIADPDKFQQWVRNNHGGTYEDFRADLRDQILRERVIREEVVSKIQLKRADLEAYYTNHRNEFERQERVFLSQVKISTEGMDSAAIAGAGQRARDLVSRLRNGAQFDGGPGDAYARDELKPEIEILVWSRDRGYVTDPIQVANAFLILRVEAHHNAGLAGFEEVQPEIERKLAALAYQPALRAYLTRLRETAFLQIKPGHEDSAAAPGKDVEWREPEQLKPEIAGVPTSRRRRWLKSIPLLSRTGVSSSR